MMPTVVLTAHLAGPAGGTRFEVAGSTVRQVLENLFVACPNLRGYLVDDQGCLRHHVAAFLDGAAIRDKQALADAVRPDQELYLLQALSGG